jgi:hypothetical protein
MGITGNEVSAANQQRHNEELARSPVGSVLESATTIAGAAVALGKSLAAGGPAGLAAAGSVVAGMGIVEYFRKLGTSKINENLEALGNASEDALNRVESVLKEQGTAIDEIKKRFDSKELRDAMASAALQALRTTQKDRLKRLALVLANGVKDNDLSAEGTDDMMRAVVELKESDIILLGKIYKSQNPMLSRIRRGEGPQKWHGDIQQVWQEFVRTGNLNPQEHLSYRSSFARLESLGLIQAVENAGMYGVGQDIYALLMEGAKFYERLQEISAENTAMK